MTKKHAEANDSEPKRNGTELACARIEELNKELAALEERSVKKRMLTLRIGIGLIAFCAIYLSILTSKAFQIDAQALTEFGRLQVESQLPEGARTLRDYFEDQAPEIVDQLIEQALASVSGVREKVTDDLEERSSVIIAELDEELSALSAEVVRAGRANLDGMPGETSDIEKFEMLMNTVAEQIRGEIDGSMEALYPRYSQELGRVKKFLVELQHKTDSELSERERIQKELIETTFTLVGRDFDAAMKARRLKHRRR